MSALRLAILNDYEVVVQGLHGMLAPFSDRVQVLEMDARKPVIRDVDVVLWDTFAQPRSRSERADLVAGIRGSGARVVVYSWASDRAVVEDVLRRGAHGYVCKSASALELVGALERVCRGDVVRVPDNGSTDAAGRDWPGRAAGLTEREAEIVGLIASGLSNQEIADRAYLSINSVKTYIRTAYRKIGVSRRSQAVRWAISQGFLPDRTRSLPDDVRS